MAVVDGNESEAGSSGGDQLGPMSFFGGSALLFEAEHEAQYKLHHQCPYRWFLMQYFIKSPELSGTDHQSSGGGQLGPMSFFGGLALLFETNHEASVTAASALKCAVIKKEDFQRYLSPLLKTLQRQADPHYSFLRSSV
ncbi:unnamed protein product, partial [Adineta steineri]